MPSQVLVAGNFVSINLECASGLLYQRNIRHNTFALIYTFNADNVDNASMLCIFIQ